MKVGDRVRLPRTLSQPAGEYRVVAVDANYIRFVSTKEGVKRGSRRQNWQLCLSVPYLHRPRLWMRTRSLETKACSVRVDTTLALRLRCQLSIVK